MKNLGLYVHIPFCVSKCAYCDFLSAPADGNFIDRYIDALCAEIAIRAKVFQNYSVDTLYIGGGTPTVLSEGQFARVFSALKNFKLNLIEATVEANPESLKEGLFCAFKNFGINRISVGVQSLNDNILKEIGRAHNARQAIDGLKLALSQFENVSADMMLGLPRQTAEDALYTADTLSAMGVKHISAYGLILEKGTKLYKRAQSGEFRLDEDLSADMYEGVVAALAKRGLTRYEVSNFAKDGYECAHNLKYWNRDEYLGLGAGAASFVDGMRFNNIRNTAEYVHRIEAGRDTVVNRQKIAGENARFEQIMLSLRTQKGLDLGKFKTDFGDDFCSRYESALEKNQDYLLFDGGFLKIRPQYFEVMNGILIDFMD